MRSVSQHCYFIARLLALVGWMSLMTQAGQAATIGSVAPSPAMRGDQVTITGTGLASPTKIQLCVQSNCDQEVQQTAPATDTTATFLIPPTIAPGLYRVRVVFGDTGNVEINGLNIIAPTIGTIAPASAMRGELITITGTGLASLTKIQLCDANDCDHTAAQSLPPTDTTASFLVPANIPLGSYRVRVSFGDQIWIERPGLGVVSPLAGVTLVSKVFYPISKDANQPATFTIRVSGTGFSRVPDLKENRVLFQGHAALVACMGFDPAKASRPTKYAGCDISMTVLRDAGETEFEGIPFELAGATKVQFQTGDGDPSPELDVKLSRVDRARPAQITVILVVVLGLLVVAAMAVGNPKRMSNGTNYKGFLGLIIEPETSTYSLSKLQLVLWSGGSIAAYLYLLVIDWAVQGSLVIPAVPDNLPGIIAISAGSTVVSSGITSGMGSKGSGDFAPRLSDLITSGGVVAPERMQFLLWTIVGWGAFMFYTFTSDPASTDTLPAVPISLLTLMGISSGGYLGGKIARGPGPVITQLTATVAAPAAGAAEQPAVLTLTVIGTYLGTQTTTYLLTDISNATPVDVTLKESPDKAPGKSDIDPATHYATKLTFSIPDQANLAFTSGRKIRFTIINPDSEKAQAEVTLA